VIYKKRPTILHGESRRIFKNIIIKWEYNIGANPVYSFKNHGLMVMTVKLQVYYYYSYKDKNT